MKSAILSIALVLTFTITNAQNLINGVVTNKQKEPLSGATIYLQPGNHETVSNEDGQFVFRNLKTGTYLLKASYIGYKFQEKTIVLDGNKTMNVVLEKQVFQTKEVTISSTRATDKTPTSYTNISKEEISSNRSAQDIPYLLQLTPSVVTTSDAGAGVGYTNFRIRGTDLNRINVTVNDIPLNDAESHGVFFVNMPDFAESTNTIQVQRGVGTSTNGAAAFGASVNFQTNDIEVSPYAEVNNAFGSFNTQKNTFKAGTGLINGVYSFDARLSRIKSDGFIDRASSDLKSFFASGTYRGDKNIVRVNIFSGKERTYQAWEGIPKAKLDGDSAAMMDFALNSGYSQEEIDNLFDSDARTFNRYLHDNQTDNYQQDHYQVFYTRTISKNITANAAYHQTNGFGYYESYKYNKKIADFDADNIVMSNDTITRSDVVIRKYLDNIFYGGVGSVKFNYETLKATVGGGWNRYDGDHFGEITWAQNSIGTFTTNHEFYRNTGVKDDANAYARINYMATNALYLYADIQYRHINYKVNGFDDDMRDLTQKHEYDFVNPKIGIFLQPSENISAYLNLAKANREPNRTTLIDADPNKPEPKHEELYNAELGGSIMSEKWSIKANSYLMYYYDQLVLTGNINDVGSAIMENVDKSYRAGIEVMWGIAPTDWLKWTGNMTFSQNKILNFTSYTDNWDNWETGEQEIEEHGTTDISFSPEIIANSNIELKPLENLSVNFITQYVGEQYIDNTSNEDRKLDAYLVNNLRIDYSVETSWWKDATIYLQVNNIFDNEYITNAWIYPFYYGDELNKLDGYYPQAGINFMAGLNLHF